MPQPYNLFTIYAREDARLLSELLSQLKPLEISGRIKVWSDREINPGVQWEQEIVSHLDTADIILILVSPAYYNSEYIHRVEIKYAVERHNRGEAKVLPIIARPCSFEDDSIVSSLQVLPTDGKAVTDDEHWGSRDKAWLDVINGVKRTIAALRYAESRDEQADFATEKAFGRKKEKEEQKRKITSSLSWRRYALIGSGMLVLLLAIGQLNRSIVKQKMEKMEKMEEKEEKENAIAIYNSVIGIELRDLSNEEQQRLGLKGAVIANVRRGSIAFQTDVRRGFIVTTINDARVVDVRAAIFAIELLEFHTIDTIANAVDSLILDGYYEGDPNLHTYRLGFVKENR